MSPAKRLRQGSQVCHTPDVNDDHGLLRDAEIDAYGVLDRPQRRDLLALTGLVARIIGVPMATINLLTTEHQHQVATIGFEASTCDRKSSMCDQVLREGRPILLEDATLDPRFADNPHTTGELGTIRFYAAHPLTTPGGTTIGTICTYDTLPHPVTPEMAHELATLADQIVDVLELELVRRRLQESNDRLAAFAGQVSHDLANPLAGIGMSVRLAREQLDEGRLGEAGDLLDRAGRTVDRMSRVLKDVLAAARDGSHVPTELVDLGRLAAEAVEDLGDEAAAAVRIERLPAVRNEATQLRIVLQNLLGNAVKFSRGAVDEEVVLRADRLADGWRLEVVDHGPGVPAADRERIFEPLVRLEPGTPGTGIGLSTVRNVIRSLGGEAGVTDTPGGGATFWIELFDAA